MEMKAMTSRGEVKILVGDDGSVSISGAASVSTTFPVQEDGKKKGLFTVTVGRALWKLEIVLRGDKASPLGKAGPLALVVDDISPNNVRVYAQDGIGDWNVQHTLFPLRPSHH